MAIGWKAEEDKAILGLFVSFISLWVAARARVYITSAQIGEDSEEKILFLF